jgi:hypothetical protein
VPAITSPVTSLASRACTAPDDLTFNAGTFLFWQSRWRRDRTDTGVFIDSAALRCYRRSRCR